MTTNIPPHACPNCNHLFDKATNHKNARPPKSGDFTVCVRCLVFLRFGEDLTTHAATEAELDALPLETLAQLNFFRRAIRTVRESS